MKKIILLALVLVAGASFNQATAGDKKDKKKKNVAVQTVEPVKLTSQSDSVSYAIGMEMTNGLIPFLIQQMGVDTAYMYKFTEGFEAAFSKEGNKKELTAYGAGINVAHMMTTNMMANARKSLNGVTDSLNTELVYKGFLASLSKDKTHFNDSTAAKYIANEREAYNKKLVKKNEDFLLENAKKEGVVTLPSGLQYKVLREGHGAIATTNDEVVVKYEGKLIDGTVFDSSYTRKEQTNKFRPTQVIKGWTEALTKMPEGSMWELYIPQNLAYGERQAGQIPPFSTLIFKVELEQVIKAAEKPATTTTTTPAPKVPAKETKIAKGTKKTTKK